MLENTAVRKPICIITDTTSGLGAAAAFDLSGKGFYVVLAGRSTHLLLSEIMSKIRKRYKVANLKAFHLDLSSFQSIVKFKIALKQWLLDSDLHCSIQPLINNAAILGTSCRFTSEGYDQFYCHSWRKVPSLPGLSMLHHLHIGMVILRYFCLYVIMSKIRKQNKVANLKAFHLDLSSFQSIGKFKIALEQWLLDSDLHCSILLLINNAGILGTSCRFTSEGYDQMMGNNYIGAFSLTKVLLSLLEKSPIPSRIVSVSSFTH